MKKISIELDKKQYQQLLELMYVGEYVITADERVNPDKYIELEQYFYSFYKEFKLEKWIEKDEDMFFATAKMEDDLQRYIEEFEADTFWYELKTRMAKRDVIKEKGIKAFEKMSFEERVISVTLQSEKYQNEFEKKGIQNLEIVKK